MKLLTRLLQYFAPSQLPNTTAAPVIKTCEPGTHEFFYYNSNRTTYRCCRNCPYTEYKYFEAQQWKPAKVEVDKVGNVNVCN